MSCGRCGAPWVWHGPTSTTLVGYSSPPGHDHDDNCRGREYKCANGHATVISIRRRCPTCEWVGKDYCEQLSCGGTKVDEWPTIVSVQI